MAENVSESIKRLVTEHPVLTIGSAIVVGGITGYIIAKNGKKITMLIKAGTTGVVDKLLNDLCSREGNETEILLCDSWISAETLKSFSIFKGKTRNLNILTFNIADSQSAFRSYIESFETANGITVEVRKTAAIHDRYLLYRGTCFLFGASLKDVGKKDTTITQDNASSSSFKSLFLKRWNESGYRFENGQWTKISH